VILLTSVQAAGEEDSGERGHSSRPQLHEVEGVHVYFDIQSGYGSF